jgi:hypothetical protein
MITRHQLESGAWREILPALIALMAADCYDPNYRRHSDAISARRGSLSLDVDGRPDDPFVGDFFRALDSVWPLWAHFISLDAFNDSMSLVARALTGTGGSFTSKSAEPFIERSINVLRDFYAVYDVPDDLEALERDLRAYFAAQPNAPRHH